MQSSHKNHTDLSANLEEVVVLVTHWEGWLDHGNGHLMRQESELRVFYGSDTGVLLYAYLLPSRRRNILYPPEPLFFNTSFNVRHPLPGKLQKLNRF